ncbi:type VI secretion system contractile sheath large subunit [Vibrio makurazakiensis]|uniref:type VI secretion system contractile sheath domain-containing protein n=1 Tax=Vibrio makurazakiensis TaxID=2910250 RepID=UPI003D0C677D
MKLNTDWQNEFNSLDNKDNAFLKEALSLLSELDESALNSKASLISLISKLIAEIDTSLSKQLDEILHDGEFQKLERNWLGLKQLSSLPISYQRTHIKLLDMSWNEISSDVNQAYSIKTSSLYNKIGNNELNTLGGQPFGCIAFSHPISMDIEFDSDYDDLFTLELLGKLGETTLCPMLFSPDSKFFGESGADWVSDTDRINKILSGPDFQAWQDLRNKPSSRFIGMAFPQVRVREAYQNKKAGFIYNEQGQGTWGPANIAFVSTIAREFQRVNWFGFLKSRWNDKLQGAVVNLPRNHYFNGYLDQPVVDVALFGQISNFYAQSGFIPLTKSPLTNKYYFNGNNSIWQCGENDNDKVLTQIQTTLMSCRIAHNLKVQVREMIGSFSSAAECELYLTQWIEKFSSNVSFANEETLSKYPLSFAKISVTESPSQAGSFFCTLRIVPQYQFDHFSGEVVLTTDLDEVA